MQTPPYILLGILALSFWFVSAAPGSTAEESNLQVRKRSVSAPSCTTVDTLRHKYNGRTDPFSRWTNFDVQLSPENTEQERQNIENAMQQLRDVLPCVNFNLFESSNNPSGDYIKIVRGTNNGCRSWIGKLGGMQEMDLQIECMETVGIIVHEMCHALGLAHEQSRPDRDDYVTIHLENVIDGMEHNFDKMDSNEYDTYGVAYNYRSIMHYEADAFTKNGQPTIESKTGEPVGTEHVLKDTDIAKLQAMYNC